MRKCTIKDLPNDIKKAVENYEFNALLKEIITKAEAGEFHDFKSEDACAKTTLYNLLHHTGDVRLEEIKNNVAKGVYDESPDEEDKAKIKKDFFENGGTEQMWNAMFGDNN